MNVSLDNLYSFVHRETLKVIRETLDSQMGDNDDERARQRKQARQIDKRDLHAADAEEEDDLQQEQEEEETEEKVDVKADLETGVPADADKTTKSSEPRADRTGGKGTADSPKLNTPTRTQIKKVTVGSVIDKLNALRGGRSLKDPKVRKSFNQYFNALSKGQRETLLVFLTGVSQILAGVAQGEEALDPSDVGLTSSTVKTKEKPKKKKAPSTEEERPGTEMQPIIVGESRRRPRTNISHAIKAYKRNK